MLMSVVELQVKRQIGVFKWGINSPETPNVTLQQSCLHLSVTHSAFAINLLPVSLQEQEVVRFLFATNRQRAETDGHCEWNV